MLSEETKQNNEAWPPTPTYPKLAAVSEISFGSPAELVPGILAGILLHVVVVIVGSILILILGTRVLGSAQPGQAVYKPILPYPVLDTLFALCHLPALALFLRLRRHKMFFAYGLIAGSLSGMAFLIWLWMSLSSDPPHLGFS